MLTVFYNNFTYYNIVCVKFSKNDDDTIMIILEKSNGKLTYFNIDHIIDLTILPQK